MEQASGGVPTKVRQGVRGPEFLQTPLLLSQKTYKKINILVGYDPTQTRFVEQCLSLPCTYKECVRDEEVVGQTALYRVDSSRNIDLSPKVRESIGVWSLDPIIKGSSGANAIIKFAADLLGKDKLDREQVQLASDELMKDKVDDVRGAIWRAVWLLSGEPLKPIKFWRDPWDDYIGWLPPDVDPAYRLNTLYWHILAYTFTLRDEEQALKKTGAPISPSRLKKLKGLKLDITKVEQTYYELSQWRSKKTDPYICALKLRNIWDPQY